MKIINRKTRKAIRKSFKKVIKKHGPKIAAGLAGGIASTLATLASTEAPGSKGKQTNLGKVSTRITDMISAGSGKLRKSVTSEHKLEKKGKREKKRTTATQPVEQAL